MHTWDVIESSPSGDAWIVLGQVQADDEDEALNKAAQYFEKPKNDLVVERK